MDDIPKDNRGFFDWKNSIGKKIKFVYDEIQGELPIVNYFVENKRNYIMTEYNNANFRLWIGDISKCKLGSLLGKYKTDFMYSLGEIIKTGKNGKLKIIKQTKMKIGKRSLKAYICECLVCGDTFEKTEDELKRNGCAVCSGRKILKGYNDLWTKRPDIANLLKFPARGHIIGRASNTKEILICPDCNYEQTQTINNVYRQGYSCKKCGDGVSYPEKFMTNFLLQLEIKFTTQESFEWSENKRYDFFIPSLKCIIETHGEQHYRDCGFERTLEEEQENDKLKESLARANGIDNYIVIDCRKSELEWIRDSILNSNLVKYCNLHNVDWKACDKSATESNVKVASGLWETGNTISKISNILKVHEGTVRTYLKRGSALGWNSYDPKIESEKGIKKMAKMNKLQIVQLSINGEYIRSFNGIKEASKEVKTSDSNISCVLKGRTKTAGGYKWVYKEDYDKYSKE